MPPVPGTDSGTHGTSARSAGQEPLPGYVLVEPLGRGGFGEVWKCVAPGGLLKAVKFVAGESDEVTGGQSDQLRQEFAAFEQIKAIRHPFLLTLERVELVGAELVMVMELADSQLHDRFEECKRNGLPGIPRDELLGYLEEAAEALDMIGVKHGLQHLDVKPANLFLIAGHVKVGDYGLVSRQEGAEAARGRTRGLTPRYVAPEVLRGDVDPRSDQYSLALVYHELLTGGFPYSARSARQMMVQHLTAEPDLSGLPACDRPAVARALSKNPRDRFGSCLEFVRALTAAPPRAAPVEDPAEAARRSRDAWSVTGPAGPAGPALGPVTPPPSDTGSRDTAGLSGADVPTRPCPPTPPPSGFGLKLPPLIAAGPRTPPPAPLPTLTPPPASPTPAPVREPSPPGVRLPRIRSVVPVPRLVGRPGGEVDRTAAQMVEAVFRAAVARGSVPLARGEIIEQPDGTWVCRFPTSVLPQVAPVKLDLLWERGGVSMDVRDPTRVVFQKQAAPTGLWGSLSKQKSGLEVVVHLHEPGRPVGEVLVTGRVFGTPDPQFVESAPRTIRKLIEEVRAELMTPDRRRHPRAAADFPAVAYPLHSDGRVEPPVPGRCKDVSASGLALLTRDRVKTRYLYVAFEGVPGAEGLAVLLRVLRTHPDGDEVLVAGEYMLDRDGALGD